MILRIQTDDWALFLLDLIAVSLVAWGICNRDKVIRFERKAYNLGRRYARAFIWFIEAIFAEGKKDMFVIIKTPGYVPEKKHHIQNTFDAIYKEIDSENPNSIEIMPNVFMCYDTDGAAKQVAPCMTDERVNNIYYGDIVFYALNMEGNAPRCLTEREAAFVMNYIANFRAEKHMVAKN